MKKLIKFLLYGVAGIIVLLVLAGIALKFFIDPNDYKEQISAQASKAAGREISIEGDLSLSVFPWLGIEMGRVTIGNAPGFSGQFASVENTGAAVKLLPLLGKDIQINRILLDGLNADLQVNANGVNNWSDFGARSAPEIEQPEGSSASVRSLSIARVDITNGAVSLDNARSSQRMEISDFNLNASGIQAGEMFAVDGGFLLSMPRDSASYRLDLDGGMLFDPASGQLNLDDMQLRVADQSAQPLPPVNLALSGELNSQSGLLNLPKMELTVDDLNLSGNVTGRNVLSAPELNGSLLLREFNPKSVAAAFGAALPELNDGSVMESFSGQLQLASTPQRIQITDLRATLDDSTLTGTAGMSLGARPAYRFDMNIDQINLDRYLPKADPNANTGQHGDASGISTIPVETFRAIDAQGNFSVGNVTINNLNASNIAVQMQADRSGWQFDPLSADFYNGRFSGAISIDATGDSPILRTDDNLNNVVAQAMLADMLGTDFLNGLALFDADLNADINRPTETLTGEVSFDIRDGAINGVNIAELLRKGFSVAQNLNLSAASNIGEEFLQGGGQTDFASLSGRFVADNGVIRNNDLRLLSPLLRVQGEGMVDLPNNRIDYNITAALVKTLQGQGGADLSELTGKQIPIRITGTLDAPRYSVDPRALLNIVAGQRVQQQKDRLLEKVGERLGGDDSGAAGLLDNVLSDALGTKTRQQQQAEQAADNAESTPESEQSSGESDDGNVDQAGQSAAEESSAEEEVAGALLNTLFNRRRQADDQPADTNQTPQQDQDQSQEDDDDSGN